MPPSKRLNSCLVTTGSGSSLLSLLPSRGRGLDGSAARLAMTLTIVVLRPETTLLPDWAKRLVVKRRVSRKSRIRTTICDHSLDLVPDLAPVLPEVAAGVSFFLVVESVSVFLALSLFSEPCDSEVLLEALA